MIVDPVDIEILRDVMDRKTIIRSDLIVAMKAVLDISEYNRKCLRGEAAHDEESRNQVHQLIDIVGDCPR